MVFANVSKPTAPSAPAQYIPPAQPALPAQYIPVAQPQDQFLLFQQFQQFKQQQQQFITQQQFQQPGQPTQIPGQMPPSCVNAAQQAAQQATQQATQQAAQQAQAQQEKDNSQHFMKLVEGKFDDLRVIKKADLEDFGDHPLGKGITGKVWKCGWRGMEVAAKEALVAKIEEVDTLVHELAIYDHLGTHPNLVEILGYMPEPPSLVMTLMGNQCLETYLLKNQALSGPDDFPKVLSLLDQCAQGMLHLHCEGVLHRDVASRNFLLDSRYRVCIADFGLSIILNGNNTSIIDSFSPIPVPWMAPEALKKMLHSRASDVYMFGSTIYEIFMQNAPWSEKSAGSMEGIRAAGFAVVQGERPPIPSFWPEPLKSLVLDCWKHDPAERPTIQQVLKRIRKMCKDAEAGAVSMPMEKPEGPASASQYFNYDQEEISHYSVYFS
jgi:hypothetical protein